MLLLLGSTVYAFEISPFSIPNVTVDEWNKYHEQTLRELESTRRICESQRLETFSDAKTQSAITFTMPGHAAHPSWVTRQVTSWSDPFEIKVIGFYSGDKEAFETLLLRYQESAERTMREKAQRAHNKSLNADASDAGAG